MWWLLIILPLLMLFSYLLFAPFILEIDSDKGIYRVRFHRIVSANLNMNADEVYLKLNFAGWKKQYNLLELISKPTEKKPAKKKE